MPGGMASARDAPLHAGPGVQAQLPHAAPGRGKVAGFLKIVYLPFAKIYARCCLPERRRLDTHRESRRSR